MVAGTYAILKYLPNRERDEPRNIGVILASNSTGHLLVRMTRQPRDTNLSREQIDALDGFVTGLQSQLQARLVEEKPELILRKVVNEFANSLVASEPKPVVIDDPQKVLDRLFDELVKPQAQSIFKELIWDFVNAVRERQKPHK